MVLAESDLKQLCTANVLVVGDSMLDRYWMGDVNRISPEAPVPVISVTREEKRMGGAANVAKNIASMNSRPVLLSIVGQDEAGNELNSMLAEANIDARLQFDVNLKTTVKLRLIARNQQLVRADFESTPSNEILAQALESYISELAACDVVLVSDYGKGGVGHIVNMIKAARQSNKPVYIDPKGSDYSIYKGASLLTPNLVEFQQVVGQVHTLDDINVAAQQLMKELDLNACLITLSERGMLLCQQNLAPIHQPTRAREVYDVTGAGDTVIAMMALACAAGLKFKQAIVLASHAASVVVSKMGTATTNIDEILSSMEKV